jgi:hypothetical protein
LATLEKNALGFRTEPFAHAECTSSIATIADGSFSVSIDSHAAVSKLDPVSV